MTVAERTYHTIDKRSWPRGPWDDEPDKIQWTDEATGLPCLIVRGPLGALCGYAGVAEGHPLFGRPYTEVIPEWCTCPNRGGHREDNWYCSPTPAGKLPAHGGLTYSEFCSEGPEDQSICHVPAPGEPDRVFWFGFDCAHPRDLTPAMSRFTYDRLFAPGSGPFAYRDVSYVRTCVAELAIALAGYRESL